MPRPVTKYLVSDEEGPLRAFYVLQEAQRFAGEDRTISKVKEPVLEAPKASYGDLMSSLGNALV
jgi:hypothetical protein